MCEKLPESLHILKVPVTFFGSYQHAIACIAHRIEHNSKTFCVVINPEKIYCAGEDPALLNTLQNAHIGICDGIGVSIAAKILHGRYLPRCTGVDLFIELVKASIKFNWRIFLLGASEEANEGAYSKLKEQYPDIRIVGHHDGYFENIDKIIEIINASNPDILFVAMGSPKQELWIHEHIQEINAKFFFGVGGTFDVISGKVRRSPSWIRKIGLEYFYRFCQFPNRWNRHHRRPIFALKVMIEKIRQILKLSSRV